MRMGPQPARETDVDEALARGEVLRTHILRPTWHYVAPADIRTFMRLTGARVVSGTAHRMRSLELDAPQINTSLDIIQRLLEGGNHLTRLELQAELDQAGLHPDGQRIAHIVMAAELSLLIASGPPSPEGKPTYALLDEFAPPTAQDLQPFDRELALKELTHRFFTSHGPATIGDFVWWSGVNGAATKRGIALNGPALESFDVAGEPFWWAGDVGGSADSPPSPAVHLMQAYDEYVVAYKSPRTPINVAGLSSPAVLQVPPFFHGIFVDSQVVGFWRRATAKDGYRIDTTMLRPLDAREHVAFGREVQRYSDFVQRPVSVS